MLTLSCKAVENRPQQPILPVPKDLPSFQTFAFFLLFGYLDELFLPVFLYNRKICRESSPDKCMLLILKKKKKSDFNEGKKKPPGFPSVGISLEDF